MIALLLIAALLTQGPPAVRIDTLGRYVRIETREYRVQIVLAENEESMIYFGQFAGTADVWAATDAWGEPARRRVYALWRE